MSTKPTFVLVPGAWHDSSIYDPTIVVLSSHGYSTIAIPLPSVGAKPAHENFDGDVSAIKACLTSVIEDQGKDVVLVLHSYSGMPGSEACLGLGKAERLAKGLEGGIIRVVSIAAFSMKEGFCILQAGKMGDWITVNMEDKTLTVTPPDAYQTFYNDMSESEAQPWIAKLQHQSMGAFGSTQTYAAWRHIPSTYVIPLLDQTDFKPPFINYIIEEARREVPTAFDIVETCEDGGHCLMISRPEWLGGVLRRAAGESC